MKGEIFYFSGCPNHLPAGGLVWGVLQQEGMSAEMRGGEVRDGGMAGLVGFLGSPSIRVDGQDIEPSARSVQAFGMTCRTYTNQGQRAGVPPREWIRDAVREAKER